MVFMYDYKRWKQTQFLMRILQAAKKSGIDLIVHNNSSQDPRYFLCMYLKKQHLLYEKEYVDDKTNPDSDINTEFFLTHSGKHYFHMYQLLSDDMEANCNLMIDTSRKQVPIIFCIALWIIVMFIISFEHLFPINWTLSFSIIIILLIISFYQSYRESVWNRRNKKIQKHLSSMF